MKSLKKISKQIIALEAQRDFGDITSEELELLAVLNLCYDLLSRTQIAQAIKVATPEEMKEPDFTDDETQAYGVSSSQLADFAFTIATKQGRVSLRELFREIKGSTSNKKIEEMADIRASTISDYMTSKSSLTTDNFEKVINCLISKKC